MINQKMNFLEELKKTISKEKKIVREINFLLKDLKKVDPNEKEIFFSQINSLKNSLRETNTNIPKILEKIYLIKSLHPRKQIKKPEISIPPKPAKLSEQTYKKSTEQKPSKSLRLTKKMKVSGLEKETLKRLKKGEEKLVKKKVKKPKKYVKLANKIFSKSSKSLSNKKMFETLKRDLTGTNLQLIPSSYISIILFTTLLSTITGAFIFLFFLFCNIGAELPIITIVTEDIGTRFLKVFWILFVTPLATFLIMYFYPSMERKSIGTRIDQELPFATIHMAAISGSLIEPSKIFKIIISTKEYPYLKKEFTKLINEINIYGYDLVTALRSIAFKSPSKKLTDLFNSLATTINSGGDLPEFFDRRAQSLLFEYQIEREKYTKSAETFMDIYISVVIAAPMILMLLLMMIRISGLGIPLSAPMITLMMVSGVSIINIVFLTFLHLKQPSG